MTTIPKMRIEHIGQCVACALESYRCQHTQDGDGNALELMDVLTPLGAADITDGKHELELLAEHITMAIVDESEVENETN